MVYGMLHQMLNDGSINTLAYDDFNVIVRMGGGVAFLRRIPSSEETDMLYGIVGACKGSPNGREKVASARAPEGWVVTGSARTNEWPTNHVFSDGANWNFAQICSICGH